MRSIIHQSLLQPDGVAESLVVTNGPRITVDFVHLVGWNAAQAALFDDTGILANDMLDNLQIFHSDKGLHIGRLLPFDDLALSKVDMTIEHLSIGGDDHNISYPIGFLSVVRIGKPLQHLSLGRL